MTEKVILCVDDENIILQSLKTELFSLFGSEFTIETAESAQEALDVFSDLTEKGVEIPVAIIDYIMPMIKGDELCKRMHAISPYTQKIILSGQATMEGITNAINHANLFQYLEKPWKKEELSLAIKSAIAFHDESKNMLKENRMLEDKKRYLENQLLIKSQEEDFSDTQKSILAIRQLEKYISLFKELHQPILEMTANMDSLAEIFHLGEQGAIEHIEELLNKERAFQDISKNQLDKITQELDRIKTIDIKDVTSSLNTDTYKALESLIYHLKNKLQQ